MSYVVSNIKHYYGHLRLPANPVITSDTLIDNRLRLPTLRYRSSQVHRMTFYRHAIS